MYANTGHVLGPKTAAVTLVEFSDFECPFCARFAAYMDSLHSLGADVRVVYRHFPAARHEFALPAIRASECAAEQDKFEAMHASLFRSNDSIGAASWWWFAKNAGLQDSARFHSCMERSGPIPALMRDTLDARRLGAKGTPTLLIHDIRLNGLPSFDSLRAYIDRARVR
jgi:protein-disulfide isomerase